MTAVTIRPMIHITFEGRSVDIGLHELDVGDQSSDNAVREAVANFLGVPESKLRAFALDRHSDASMTLRPEAVFG